ncbi:hypothetical protein M758_5G043900 [Ceratodon purpureus]|nr:hypothetical protein M758_5G043900 [Ceratodon purpureus]
MDLYSKCQVFVKGSADHMDQTQLLNGGVRSVGLGDWTGMCWKFRDRGQNLVIRYL